MNDANLSPIGKNLGSFFLASKEDNGFSIKYPCTNFCQWSVSVYLLVGERDFEVIVGKNAASLHY